MFNVFWSAWDYSLHVDAGNVFNIVVFVRTSVVVRGIVILLNFALKVPCVDDERRQILEEAAKLDHITGVWEVEKEPTNVPGRWIRQPSRNRDDMRHHVEVYASHREKEWESPSASLIEQDPEVIPDVDIAAHVGRDFFFDEKIPRHESGQGYVRVVEQSIMCKDKTASKIFTYQGLTTCTEVDKSWTIMSSIDNHLR